MNLVSILLIAAIAAGFAAAVRSAVKGGCRCGKNGCQGCRNRCGRKR